MLLALLLTTTGCSRYKNNFYFNGDTYVHIKKMSGGEIVNHFYTPYGEDMNTAEKFVQILEFSDKINQSQWSRHIRPLLDRYKLVPVADEEFEVVGQMQQSGHFFISYGAPIVVNGKESMAFFITLTDQETFEKEQSITYNAAALDIIRQLKAIDLD